MANMLGVVVPHLRDSCARELVFCLFKDAYWAVVHSTCILQAALELLPDNGNITLQRLSHRHASAGGYREGKIDKT